MISSRAKVINLAFLYFKLISERKRKEKIIKKNEAAAAEER